MAYPDIISVSDGSVPPDTFGHKAHWISWLNEHGFEIPKSVFLKAVLERDSDWIYNHQARLREALDRFKDEDGLYDIAIRSSATCEDTADESLAGHFDSFIGAFDHEEVLRNIEAVISSIDRVDDPSCKMGVVLQKRIEPSFSGVIFSTHPVTRRRSNAVISITEGMGQGLVSGEEAGHDIAVEEKEGEISFSTTLDVPRKSLDRLFKGAKRVEQTIGQPVDIEWCIQEATGDLHYLQCRPATGISLDDPAVVPVGLDTERLIPSYLSDHPKISSRLTAESNDVYVTDSHVVIVNCWGGDVTLPDLSDLSPSNHCESYTSVLIYPETVAGEVQRAFLPSTSDSSPPSDDRYRVSSEPEYADLRSFIAKMSGRCCGEHWNLGFVVQEIYDASYTGIVRRLPEGEYLIEVGYGHFVPKGVITPSRYLLDSEMRIVERTERYQDKQFHIRDGYVLEEPLLEERPITFPEDALPDIVDEYAPFLDTDGTTVEFGVVETEKSLQPFLIDHAREENTRILNRNSAAKGVISPGCISGEVVEVDSGETEKSLHTHFHDQFDSSVSTTENYLLYCDRPDISFLNLLEEYPDENVGFIFDQGSLLAHFPIILRERDIPAITVPENVEIRPGAVARLDTNADVDDMLTYIG